LLLSQIANAPACAATAQTPASRHGNGHFSVWEASSTSPIDRALICAQSRALNRVCSHQAGGEPLLWHRQSLLSNRAYGRQAFLIGRSRIDAEGIAGQDVQRP
jgi:hypothetical protein